MQWKQRVAYFFAGLSVGALCLWTSQAWLGLSFAALLIGLRFAKGKQVRWLSYLIGGIVPAGLLTASLIIPPVLEDHKHRIPFDAKLWRNENKEPEDTLWPPRLCMVDDLMDSHKLDGMTNNAVIDSLGLPHSKDFPFGARQCDIHYLLGPERGLMRIDSEWLFIALDSNGKVDRYWIYRD
jgi:hypothetical protein